jgi:uncharacterized membrane protein
LGEELTPRAAEAGWANGSEAARKSALRVYLGLIAFSIFGTILVRFGFQEPVWIARIASLATILSGTAVLWFSLPPANRTTLSLALIFGATSEILGLYTGFPFGQYRYTGEWWPSLPLPMGQNFPLALPFAWLMIAGASRLLLPPEWSRLKAALATGLLAALIDVPMEPVMTAKLGYWEWVVLGPLPGGAPILNFFGWFLVSALVGFFLKSAPEKSGRQAAIAVLAAHLVLVAVLAFA